MRPLDDRYFEFCPATTITAFRGSYDELAGFIEAGAWAAASPRLVALQLAPLYGLWYLFQAWHFELLTSRWMEYEAAIRNLTGLIDLFDLREARAVATVPSSAPQANGTCLVVNDTGELAGAWIERQDFRSKERGVLEPVFAPARARGSELRRTPHLAFNAGWPLQPGDEFVVLVYADASPMAKGEDGEDIVISDPMVRPEYELSVWLAVSDHFEIVGPETQSLLIRRDENATGFLKFRLRVCSIDLGHRGCVTASFMYQGRPCGRVSRGIPLGSADVGSVSSDRPSPQDFSGSVRVDASARSPDLTLVVTASNARDDRYGIRVASPHFSEERNAGLTERWRLGKSAETYVADHLALFSSDGAGPSQRIAELRRAGCKLFASAPKIFQDAVLALIDAGKLGTLLIVSEEPHIPWELMIPVWPEGSVSPLPLGAHCAVGRWINQAHLSPPQSLVVHHACVVAPQYVGPIPRPLEHSEAERDMLLDRFSGTEAEPADFNGLIEALKACPAELLHFICHGTAELGSTIQFLELIEGNRFSSTAVGGSADLKAAFAKGTPLVFINACEAGRTCPDLSGMGGFAHEFIAIGASAVVAPLWSAADKIAHEVASIFYGEHGDQPAAEILRQIRTLTYEGKGAGADTYASYCFYGDPHLILCRSAARQG